MPDRTSLPRVTIVGQVRAGTTDVPRACGGGLRETADPVDAALAR